MKPAAQAERWKRGAMTVARVVHQQLRSTRSGRWLLVRVRPTTRPPTARVPLPARPVHFPQRGIGTLRVDRVPPAGSADFARLVDQGRRARRVLITGECVASTRDTDLIALAAGGAPLELDGATLATSAMQHAIAQAGTPEVAPTSHRRELRSVQVRRSALTKLDQAASTRPVSVLLATRRPHHLLDAVGQVAAQHHGAVQLVVGLHGPGFDDATTTMIRERWNGPLVVERFDAADPFGRVLAALTDRADGTLVSKWDDDDWYGVHHVGDLVLAYDYSGADIVGKAAEFVHLSRSDRTLRRAAVGAESYSWMLAGGTLTMAKSWLTDVGGWPHVVRRVDLELLDSARRSGARAYRTHGFEYVLRRTHDVAEHTWAAPDTYFEASAAATRPGLDLAFAGFGEGA